MESTTGETEREQGYIEGRRRTLINLLSHALSELSGFKKPEDEALISLAYKVKEREEVIQLLRRECAKLGANDWPDTLHLADIIEKYLLPNLREP